MSTEYTTNGDGSQTDYPFTFPYLKESDIKATVAGVAKTQGTGSAQWQFHNATTVKFNTAPPDGSAIRIYRETADTNLTATFYAGSAIKSQDLNDNFTQNLYVTQEVRESSELALTNSREHDGDGTYTSALSKANTAIVDAASATSTASTASGNASTALATANSADAKADSAIAAVSASNVYNPVANVAAIPSSPTDGYAIQVTNSTGIESFSPLTGLPSGFTGHSALAVRLIYSTNTWTWNSYYANDPEARYAVLASPTFTGTPAAPTAAANTNTTQIATTAYVQGELTDMAPKASPALTGTATGVNLTLSGNLTVNGTTTTINSTTLAVDDKNIELGTVDTPSDTTADGGGITLKGATDKTFNWVDSTDSWTSSENIELAAGKIFKDDKGNLRSIPANTQTSAHVATAADAGKAIYISTGGVTVNNSVFAAGDAVTIINNSGSDQTITQGSGVTIHNAADAATGNRTLAGRGMATVWFASASVAYISGAGLS